MRSSIPTTVPIVRISTVLLKKVSTVCITSITLQTAMQRWAVNPGHRSRHSGCTWGSVCVGSVVATPSFWAFYGPISRQIVQLYLVFPFRSAQEQKTPSNQCSFPYLLRLGAFCWRQMQQARSVLQLRPPSHTRQEKPIQAMVRGRTISWHAGNRRLLRYPQMRSHVGRSHPTRASSKSKPAQYYMIPNCRDMQVD